VLIVPFGSVICASQYIGNIFCADSNSVSTTEFIRTLFEYYLLSLVTL